MSLKNVHRSSIFLAYMSLFVQGIADNIRGPLFPDILTQFHLDNRVGSLFFSTSSGFMIPGAYFTAHFLGRFGSLQTLKFSSALLVIALLGIGLSPTFPLVLCSVVLMGLSYGAISVVQNVMVIDASPPVQVQKWQSGLQSMYGLASLGAPLLVLLMHYFSSAWQWSFLVTAGFVGLLFVSTFWGEDLPHLDRNPIPAEKASGKTSSLEGYYFCFILGAYVAIEIMVSSRLAQFTRGEAGWEPTATNILNSLFFVGLFSGRLLFTFWHPRLRLQSLLLISFFLSGLCLLAGMLVTPMWFALAGLVMAPIYPLCMTAASRLFPRTLNQITSRAIAMTGVTVVAMQTLVGYLTDHYNLRLAMLVGPGFALLGILSIVLYPRFFARQID